MTVEQEQNPAGSSLSLPLPGDLSARKIGSLAVVFLFTVSLFIAAAHVFMPQFTYMVTAEHFVDVDGPWQTASKTDYIRNHARMLHRGSSGSIAIPLPEDVAPSGINVSYYAFEEGHAELVLSRGAYVLDRVSIEQSSSGKQATVQFFLDQNLPHAGAFVLRVENTTFRYLSIDQISFSETRSSLTVGFLLQAAFASAALCASLALARRYCVGAQVSTRSSWIFIDQLRGVAILLVITLHALGGSGLPAFDAIPLVRHFVYNGHYGVELFYVVSAFTLTLSVLHAHQRGSFRYRPFVHNRFTRIVPTFVAVFAIAMFCRPLIVDNPRPLTFAMVIDNLFLSHIFDPASRVLPLNHSVWWSIATEFQFYVFLPILVGVLALAAGRRWAPAVWLAFLAVAIGISILVETSWLKGLSWSRMSAFYHIDAFAMGIVAAFAFVSLPSGMTERGPSWLRFTWFIGAILLVAVLCGVFQETLRNWTDGTLSPIRLERVQVLMAILVLLGYVVFARPGGGERSLLGTVGILSFIIYLVHVPVLRIARRLLPPHYMAVEELYHLYLLAAGLTLSLIVALALHRVVELPSARLLRGKVAGPLLAASSIYVVIFVSLSVYRALPGN